MKNFTAFHQNKLSKPKSIMQKLRFQNLDQTNNKNDRANEHYLLEKYGCSRANNQVYI